MSLCWISCQKNAAMKKTGGMPVPNENWHVFKKNERWGGVYDGRCCFYKKIETEFDNMYLFVSTGNDGSWGGGNTRSSRHMSILYRFAVLTVIILRSVLKKAESMRFTYTVIPA